MEPASSNPSTPTPVPTLHHLSSAQSLRILWALEELSIAHGQPYTLKTNKREKGRAPAELKKIFPLGRSPILEIEGVDDFRPQNMPINDNEKRTVVTEGRLILQYLADHYSRGIWQPAPDDQDRDIYWQEFANCTLAPMMDRTMMVEIIPRQSPFLIRPLMGAIFYPLQRIMRKDHPLHFAFMEAALSDEKPWFSGAKLGLADFCLSWPMDNAEQREYFDPKDYPKLAGWLKRVHEREAYRQARAKGGSYDLVNFDM
jgi:glutathione S-transferase